MRVTGVGGAGKADGEKRREKSIPKMTAVPGPPRYRCYIQVYSIQRKNPELDLDLEVLVKASQFSSSVFQY